MCQRSDIYDKFTVNDFAMIFGQKSSYGKFTVNVTFLAHSLYLLYGKFTLFIVNLRSTNGKILAFYLFCRQIKVNLPNCDVLSHPVNKSVDLMQKMHGIFLLCPRENLSRPYVKTNNFLQTFL